MVHRLPIAVGLPWTTFLIALICAAGWTPAQPPSDAPESSSSRHAELHARYADSRLRLAETRLQKAEQLNASSPGQVSETDMRSLRARVGLLREQVAEARDQPHGYGFAAQRTAARAAVQLAERDLAAATAVKNRRADVMGPLDMRLLELRLEIARLRAEIWDDPAFLASPTDVLQMQVDQLADQVQDVLYGVDNSPALDRR